jgi:hypothetical protein
MGRMADDGSGDALTDVVAELYGLTPDDFTTVRNERAKAAKAAGDKELAAAIGRLRKPSTAAWLLNQMVRHHGDEIDQFLAVGAALRDAQAGFDADQLKQLSRQRHQVVAAVARQARALARELGNPVSATVEGEVEQTLRAALSDPDAAEAVSGGQLTKTLDYAGLGDTPVDLTGAVAAPGAGPAPRTPVARPAPAEPPEKDGKAELEQAEADAAEAERLADEARGHLDDAEARVNDLEERKTELEERLGELEEEVEKARSELSRGGREARNAARDRDRAARHAESTRAQARKARAKADRLRG